MLKGFRDFILRGNVVDLAVAVVIGAAFTAIVNSLVKNIIMQIVAAIGKTPDFSGLVLNIHGTPIKYGAFINDLISFLLIAASVYFLFVLPVNKLMARFFPPPTETPKTHPCPQCLSEIPIEARRCSHCTQLVA